MKSNLKRLLSILFVMILVLCRPTIASAETIKQDNLNVKLKVEQVEGSTDEIKVKVKVNNVGVRPIDGINAKSIIPDGIKLKDGSTLTKEIGTLEVGESSNYELYGKVDSSLLPDNNEGVSEPSKDNSATNSGSVGTGDSTNILGLVVLIAISGGVGILLFRKKRNKIKQILSVFLCLTLILPFININAIKVQAYGSKKEISVRQDITIDEKLYSIETIVTYDNKANIVKPSGNIVTRGEWISKLVQDMGLKNGQEIDDLEDIFNDIEGHEYEEDIKYAKIYSIIDDEDDNFSPDEPATREFSAVTAVRALSFEGTKDIVCKDSNDITYLKEVETAVSMDILNLENNYFYPLRSLTQSEAEYVLEAVRGVLKSSEINPDYDSVIEYKENVIKLEDNISYELNESTFTFEINDKIKNLKKDDIFILPNQTPYKIINTKVEGNKAIIETLQPKIEETLDSIDAQGYGTFNMKNFIPAEGVELNQGTDQESRYVQSNNLVNRSINIDEEGSIAVPGTLNFTVDKKLSDSIKLTGNISFSLPKVEYKADVDVGLFDVDVNNVYLKFPMSTKINGRIVAKGGSDLTQKADGIIELGKAPIAGVPGVAIYAEIGLAYSVEGKVSLVYSLGGEIGVQVLNNRLRGIKTLNSKLNTPEIEAIFKVGPKISGLLEICGLWDLIDFSAFAGGAANVSATIHDTGMNCIDANIYLFAELSALKEGIIGEWLDLGYTWYIWDKSNSPLKKKLHVEDFQIVPECTYGIGIIRGTVAEAGNRTKFIKDAKVQIYDVYSNELKKEIQSDVNGQYNVKLKPGTYILKISKDGYISFESIEVLSNNEDKYVQTYLMVEQGQPGEEGIAGGKITNALTGSSISDISIEVRKGWNNVIGDAIETTSTNQSGKYEVKLPLGNYTVQMIKDGYKTSSYNIYVTSGSSLNQNSTLVPDSSQIPTGDLRVVLTWDEHPYDLDSHLVGPTVDGSSYFHIKYSNKSYYQDGFKYADLDLDDITSYGPETTTVYKKNSSGKYSFYVHDYTNRYNSSSTAMSNSGAQVKVYKGGALFATYNIPTSNVGTYWHVFDYNAETDTIVPVNNFVDQIRYEDGRSRALFIPSFNYEEKITS